MSLLVTQCAQAHRLLKEQLCLRPVKPLLKSAVLFEVPQKAYEHSINNLLGMKELC